MKTFKELFEKKLTPAELKKREEIAKAMERETPGMDMSKKMAIATAAAKRVAEEVDLDEAAKSAADYEAMAKKHVADGQKGTRANMVYASKMAGRARRAAEILKKGGSQEDAFKHYQGNVSEETELEEQTAEAPSLQKHRIGVRVTNPNNKREVKYVVVTHSANKKGAQAVGEKHFKKKGYFVHGSFHSGMVSEEAELDEVNVMNRTSPVKRGNYVHSDKSATAGKDSGTHNVVDAAGKVVASYKNKMDAISHSNKKDDYRVKSVYEEVEELDEAKVIGHVGDIAGHGKVVQCSKCDTDLRDDHGYALSNGTYVCRNGDKCSMRQSRNKLNAMAAKGQKPRWRTDEGTEDYHAQAMEHKKMSDAAMDKNDMEAYHHHMSEHHEAMGQWHESKGRSSSADKEYEKAEKHHELSLKKSKQKNEGTEMLSFKYFQQELAEAKKKCKESASEIENAHGEMVKKDDEEDDEDEEMYVKEGFSSRPASYSAKLRLAKKMEQQSKERREQEKKEAEAAKRVAEEVEIDEQAPVAPAPGMKDGKYAIMVHPESKRRVTIERKNKKNYPASEGWKEVGLGMKESVEEIEELSKKPLLSYLTKATKQEPENIAAITKANKENDPATADKALSKFAKRSAGMDRAVSKMYAKYDKPKNESVEELDEGDELNMRHKFVFNKTAAGKAREVARNREELKMQMKKTKEMGGITGPKGKLPEEVELDEISTATMSHQGKTTLKHVKNPGVQLRMAAHDIKPGIKGYRDRIALMKAADAEKKLKEEVELDEVSPFDWKAYAKEKGTAGSEKTKTFHNVKKTSTGTVYTKQVNPDGTSKGSGDDAAKAAEKADAPKRGRGRPAGVGAKTGSYKPRDPAKKAASAAKAAASKAANRAARNEEFDNEFMGSLIEGFEDEDFDEFLYCEEFDELDEATQEALINFINEKNCGSYKMKESLTGKQHKLDKNKNGKIDSHDFKLLRKEETEQIQESVNKYAAFLTKKQ